jgi:hypothetical protein
MRKKKALIGLGIAGGALVAIAAAFGALVAYTYHSLDGLKLDFDDELSLM